MRHIAPFALALAITTLPCPADDAAPQRFAMNPYHANIGRITSIEKNGVVELADVSNPRYALGRLANQPDLSEGWYVGLVGEEFTASTEDTRLVRVKVESVGEKGAATVRVSPKAAERIEKGEQIVLFRPPGSSTKQVEACPDYVAVDDGRETSVLGRSSVNFAARLASSRNNMKQIGLAMHNYHDTYGHFPPAVVYGPDGKPWHSWRVLVLPFVEGANLYDRYRFDEPWNGPNNSKLLAEIPPVYVDPLHTDGNEGHYTHYALATGPRCGFTTKGSTIDAENPGRIFGRDRSGLIRIRDFTDGTSNTVLAGSVAPSAKIPWMKPEDVVFEKEYPRPGEKGSFAAPYESRRDAAAGVFLYCDGSVRTISADIDAEDWRRLLQRNDGEPLDSYDVPGLETTTRVRPGTKAMQYVEIERTEDGLRARLVAGSGQ